MATNGSAQSMLVLNTSTAQNTALSPLRKASSTLAIISGLNRKGYALKDWNYVWMAPTNTQGDGTFFNAITDPANLGKFLLVGLEGKAAMYQIIKGPNAQYGYSVELSYIDNDQASPDFNPGDSNSKCNWWLGDAMDADFWQDIAGQTGATLAIDGSYSGHAVRLGQHLTGKGSFEREYYSSGLSVDYP